MGRYKTFHGIDSIKNSTTLLRFTIYTPYVIHFLRLKEQFASYSQMLESLAHKYMNRFYALSNAKQSSKKIYQVKTNDYQNATIRVTLTLHQFLFDISYMTGYSVSHIIRLMIEWEVESSQPQENIETSEGVLDSINSSSQRVSQNTLLPSSETSSTSPPPHTVVTMVSIFHRFHITKEEVVEHIEIEYG